MSVKQVLRKRLYPMDLSPLIKERAETGRIHIMNVDHCNTIAHLKTKCT